ncbi:MAG TPA: hypothetical protein VFO05_16960 [Candidatus Limnocylindrales bacterium]|nr:hypothetical protein [Candidatus Limnocylindrales bacterium]
MTETDRAAGRLDAFLVRLDRVGLEDLRLLSLPLPDRDQRAALLAEVDRIAIDAGRKEQVDEARRRTRDAIERAYARHQYEPTWAGLNWGRSLGTTRDRLGLTVAAEDAAVAAVMSDLLDADTAAELTEPFEHAAGMAGSTSTPSLSLRRDNRVGWVVWFLLAAAAVGVILNYTVGMGFAIVVLAFVAVVTLARRAA